MAAAATQQLLRFGGTDLRVGDRVDRVTGKIVHRSDVRQYSGGRFFTVHLMDEAGTVVGAKRWARGEEQEHANEIHALVPEGTVVTLTQCSVKPANRRYSNLASPVELTFQQTVPVAEEKSTDFEDVAPTVEYTTIANVQKDWSVNVCAVVHLDSGTQRVGAARKRKRDLVITDASGHTIDVTINITNIITVDLSHLITINLTFNCTIAVPN